MPPAERLKTMDFGAKCRAGDVSVRHLRCCFFDHNEAVGGIAFISQSCLPHPLVLISTYLQILSRSVLAARVDFGWRLPQMRAGIPPTVHKMPQYGIAEAV
jgi:hypothetical protein